MARYGDDVRRWLRDLPPQLTALANRWHLELIELIPRGSMSVVIRCVAADGHPAVLKICPDRERLAHEVAALEHWSTEHLVSVHAADTTMGALLLEAIVPGSTLAEADSYPAAEVAELLHAIHSGGTPDPSYPHVRQRVANLFDSLDRHRLNHPELLDAVPPDLLDRGRRLAHRLAEEPAPAVLLHGDLTPVNVLDGGTPRGLVAIDPAPCVGDATFDAVDLLFWNAEDVDTIHARAETLAKTMDADATRLVEWCVAFAATIASELAERSDPHDARLDTALALASAAPV